VRTGRRVAEHGEDAFLNARRDGVLEPVRLLVHVRPLEAEDVDQQTFREPVSAHHRLRGGVALTREANFLLRADRDQAVALHTVESRGNGGRSDAQRFDEARGTDGTTLTAKCVDVEEVVLDCLGGLLPPFRPGFYLMHVRANLAREQYRHARVGRTSA